MNCNNILNNKFLSKLKSISIVKSERITNFMIETFSVEAFIFVIILVFYVLTSHIV